MITATSPSPVAPGAVLTLAGRLLGTSGLVQLIGYGATSSGPIYRPGPVAYGPGRARVLLAASLSAGRYDVLVVTGGTGEPACGNGREGVLGSATTASSRGCPSTGARVPGPRAPVDQYAGPRLGLPVDRRAGAGLGLPVDRSMRWSRTWGRRRSRWLQGDQTDAIEQRGDRPAPRRGCSQAPRRRRGFESQPHGASPRPECCSSRLALQSHS